ncbi:MAG: hypothetical protein J0M24_21420 [Verrucomicrobia bacterium]|nr:hypothetical protein [Verrucomicrobiota bacterium]
MKPWKWSRLVCIVFMLAFTLVKARGINDTRITVQGSDIILRWTSYPGERFVIQQHPDLWARGGWITLNDGFPAEPDGNTTTFIQQDAVQNPEPCEGRSGRSPRPRQERAELRVPSIEGAVDATMETGAFWVETRPTAKQKLLRHGEQPPLPPSGHLSPEARQRLRDHHRPRPSSRRPYRSPCGVSQGFFRVILIPDFVANYETPFEFTEGIEFMPISFDVDPEEIAQVELFVNGHRFPYADLRYDEDNGQFGILFNHDRLANGTYNIQLRTTLHTGTVQSTDTGSTIVVSGREFETKINNPISFFDWNELIVGSEVSFQAHVAAYPADWTIEVFDADPENFDPIRVESGSTQDGTINWTWDLRDSAGNARTSLESDPYFIPVVTVLPRSSDALAAPISRRGPSTALDYPASGSWIFGYQDSDKSSGPSARETIRNAIYALPGFINNEGLGRHLVELPFGRDLNDDGTDDDPAEAQRLRNVKWQELANYFFDVPYGRWRNFYYMGHGTEHWVGGDFEPDRSNVRQFSLINPESYLRDGKLIGSNARLTSEAVRRGLTFNTDFGPRPYRFAFLDGCATAAGDFPEAFGIGKQQNDLAFYKDAQRNPRRTRPSAFVGWSELIYYSTVQGRPGSVQNPQTGGVDTWGDYQQYAFFRTQWMFNWQSNPNFRLLDSALREAQRTTTWIQLQTYNRVLKIYGFKDLSFNEFNQKADWPIP